MVVQASVDGVMQWVSSAVADTLGWAPVDLIGHRVFEYVHPDDLQRGLDAQEAVLRHEIVRLEVRFRQLNGAYRWMAIMLTPILDEHGEVIGRVAGWRDIEEDHRLREELRASEERLRLLAENASDVVTMTSLDGIVEWVSPSVTATLGWEPDELIGRPIVSLVDPRQSAAFKRAERLAGRGQASTLEVRVATKDGRWKWMSKRMHPLHDADGAVVGRVSGWRDTDEEHLAREELRRSEVQYRLVAENSSDVVLSLDTTGVMTWASPSLADQLGWRPDELIGRRNDHLVHPDDLSVLMDARRGTMQGGHGAFEARFLSRGGQYIWMSVLSRPMLDALGNTVGLVASWRNVDVEHRIREQLRRSEERLRLLVELASDVALQADNHGVVTWVTESLRTMLGWAPDQVIGQPIDIILHPDDTPIIRGAQAEVLAGREVRFEVRFLRPDGTPKWFSVVLRPTFDEHGAVNGRVAGWRDIDAERSVREQLREREEQMRFLVDNASDVVVQQVEGVVVFMSPAITPILGWKPEDFVGRLATEFWHPDDQAEAIALRHRINHGEAGGTHVMRMRHVDGSYRWMEVVGRPAAQPDSRLGAVGVLRDVTERVEAEAAAVAAQARDRLIADLSSDVYALFTPDGAIEWIAGATQDIIGAPPDALIGTNGSELFLPEEAEETAAQRERLMRGEPISGLVRIRRLDGEVRWIDRRSRAVFDDDGNLAHFATAWRDAQHDVDNREALSRSERAARDANMAKTTFLSRMSHELRTPLNAVLGFAQLLEMDELTADQQSEVAQILHGGRHLLDLINEVLDIARIEAGRMSMSPEAVLTADVVNEAAELVRPLAQQKGVSLVMFAGGECDDLVFVDRQRTIQILLNLLTNGIKYNHDGGAVRIGCRAFGDDEVAIDVSDDGMGISAEDLPRLFEPFERLGLEATGIEGTGIGLALSRGLAEMMAGRIEVHSTRGEGSTFTLVVPRADSLVHRQRVVASRSHLVSGDSSAIVLYVEDNPANAMLMRSIVARRERVVLREASTGADALDMAFADCPDVVLLDLHLPDMRGEEVLVALRADPRTSGVPVVVISADAANDVRTRLAGLGADAFLPKPVDIAAVLSWIDEPLQGRGVS